MMIEVGINSYITVEEALEILMGSKLYDRFAALSDEGKEYQLKQAAQRMEQLPFTGRKKSIMQYMSFPRKGQDDVPYQIRAAQALEAAAPLDSQAESRRTLQSQGVTSVTVGQVSESYGNKNNAQKLLGLFSEEAFTLIRRYLAGSFPIV